MKSTTMGTKVTAETNDDIGNSFLKTHTKTKKWDPIEHPNNWDLLYCKHPNDWDLNTHLNIWCNAA